MRRVAVLGALLACAAAGAQRQPVLGQVGAPHNYYFREMYLPHLTSGPSAVAGWAVARIFDARQSLEAAPRHRGRGAIDRRPGLRLSTGLVAGRKTDRFRALRRRCDGTGAA